MKLLFVYFQRDESSRAEYERIAACAPESMTVKPFGLRCPRLRWDDLDLYWRTGERALMETYEALQEAATDCDVMLHYNGWSLHPEFIKQLPTFNVYSFVDDPESSQKQSRYVAPSFDAVMYGNIASGPQYASWGCRRIAHLPIFIDPASVPAQEEAKASLSRERDNDIVLCCGMTHWRKSRLAGLMAAFPSARVHGNGWEGGWISDEQQRDLYRRSRIGWNIHNSTGPINRRMFMLAGWGVMQICDNKTGLGRLYELGREAAGFDTIPEAIELTRYYLDHEEERSAMARNAFGRFWRDYHPRPIWQGIGKQLETWLKEDNRTRQEANSVPELRLPVRHGAAKISGAVRRVIHNRLRRNMHSVTKALQQIRYGRTLLELDESVFLGKPREYRAGSRLRSAKLQAANLKNGNASDKHHLTALHWAMTALIGDESSILMTGYGGRELADLAGSDQSRTIETTEQLPAPGTTDAQYDLIICSHVNCDLQQLADQLKTLESLAPRWIMCLRQLEPSGGATCDLLYATLADLPASVHLYFLPDPHVPWLEPVDGPAPVNPLIADCRVHS